MTFPTLRAVVLLVAVFAVRAGRADQPILENYVGRQVPTAMVARNLARGSGFLAPRLDTGPFPNLFLVEPPVYAGLVALVSRSSGLSLDAAGRLVSAFATTLAAWGLLGLVGRRRGPVAAIGAVVAFAAFPVTIRYGRAFQPDAFAMGTIVAGMRCWDGRGRPRAIVGAVLIALGLAQKVTWSLVLVPIALDILRDRPRWRRFAAGACALPALGWYLHAGYVLTHGLPGTAPSVDNASNWLARLAPAGHRLAGRLLAVARDFAVRSFTPIGLALAVVGMASWRGSDRLWKDWTIASGATLLVLFGKLHHDYYWLILAPPMAAWAGIAGARLAGRSRVVAAVAFGLATALGLVQSRSTWRTPTEWRDAPELAASIGRHVPPGALVIAPEAILYLGDRRGCRLEWEPGPVRRAANEWRPTPAFDADDPVALVAFYRRVAGAGYFADLDTGPLDPARLRLHEMVRRDPRARALDDRPGRYLLIAFDGPDRPRGARP